MSKVKTLFVCLIALCLLASCGGETEDKKVEDLRVEDLSWLIGTWQDQERPNQMERWWKGSGALYGQGFSVLKGDTFIFENLTIGKLENGLALIANVSSNDGLVSFAATRTGKGLVIFENPDHDFPKLIRYSYSISNGEDYMETEVRSGDKVLVSRLIRLQ